MFLELLTDAALIFFNCLVLDSGTTGKVSVDVIIPFTVLFTILFYSIQIAYGGLYQYFHSFIPSLLPPFYDLNSIKRELLVHLCKPICVIVFTRMFCFRVRIDNTAVFLVLFIIPFLLYTFLMQYSDSIYFFFHTLYLCFLLRHQIMKKRGL